MITDCSPALSVSGVFNPCPAIISDGSDLSRAVSICLAHRVVKPYVTTPPESPEWQAPWEACRKVYAAWQESEAARRQRQLEQQIEQDREFVNGVAGGLH